MGSFKALTPTSAGFAQVFDLSGIAEGAKERRLERKKDRTAKQARLDKTMLHYDSKGLMTNHVPLYQELMEEYQGFMQDHNAELVSPGDHLTLQKERTQKENEIRDFISGSMQMNQDVGRVMPMVRTNDSYINPENEDMLDGYLAPATREQYESGNLFQPVMKNLNRNYLVDEEGLMDEAKDYLKSKDEWVENIELGMDATRTTEKLDREAFDEWAIKKYNGQNRDGGDLRGRYETIEEFKQSIEDRLVPKEDVSYSRQRQETQTKPTEADRKREYAIQDRDQSNAYTHSSVSRTTPTGKKSWTGTVKVETKNQDVSLRLYGKNTYGFNTPSGNGAAIKVQVPQAYNLTTGQVEEVPESANNMYVTEVSDMYMNESGADILIPLRNGGNYVVKPGDPLPDRYNDDFKVDDRQWEKKKALCIEKEMATAYVSTDKLDFLENAGENLSGDQVMALLSRESKTAQIMLVEHGFVNDALTGVLGVRMGVDYKTYRQNRNNNKALI